MLVALGVTLPQVSAVAAGLGLADDRLIVICTGDGLRTIRLDGDGSPVEISETAELCALVHAAGTAVPALPAAPSQSPRFEHRTLPKDALPDIGHRFSSSLPRAPPVG